MAVVERSSIEEIRMLLKYISKGYKVPEILYQEVKNAAIREVENKERVVIIKRDPNIERGRMQGRYVKIIDGNTIDMHPATTAPFGADFDGDSLWGRLRCIETRLHDGLPDEVREIICNSDELIDKTEALIFKGITQNDTNITVETYGIKEGYKLFINSINKETGESSYEEILEFTIHSNLEMYKMHDSQNRFEDFWVSSDHSLIVYDSLLDNIVEISPIELMKNPAGKYLLKQKEN
jgi:hypothetical protein